MVKIPDGYKLQRFKDLPLATIMPKDWEYWRIGGKQHYMSRERIELGPDNYYETGFMLGVFDKLGRVSRKTQAGAKSFADRPPEASLVPTGDLQTIQQDPLTIYHRQFRSPAGKIGSVLHSERHYHLAGVADEPHDSIYVATFETPAEHWKTHRAVAKLMIESIHTV